MHGKLYSLCLDMYSLHQMFSENFSEWVTCQLHRVMGLYTFLKSSWACTGNQIRQGGKTFEGD